MNLSDQETILKVYHHHPTTFFFRLVNYIIVSLPFYFVAAFFYTVFSPWQMVILFGTITLIFGFLTMYDLVLFYLDQLIITNRRIVHVDWKSALSRSEAEAELLDIQDITTKEMGIFSALKIFDYGLFMLETASTKTSIIFPDAPDPEGIKHFIYRLYQKPSRIEPANNESSIHDTARQVTEEEAAVSGRRQ
jgi:hypothetical protein